MLPGWPSRVYGQNYYFAYERTPWQTHIRHLTHQDKQKVMSILQTIRNFVSRSSCRRRVDRCFSRRPQTSGYYIHVAERMVRSPVCCYGILLWPSNWDLYWMPSPMITGYVSGAFWWTCWGRYQENAWQINNGWDVRQSEYIRPDNSMKNWTIRKFARSWLLCSGDDLVLFTKTGITPW